MKSLDLVTFDTSSLVHSRDRFNARLWSTQLGDRVRLRYYPLPPDIGADITDAEAIKRFYWEAVARDFIGFVEAYPLEIDGCRAVRVITKEVPEPGKLAHGYTGSVMVPFRYFNYIIQMEAQHRRSTWAREDFVMKALIRDGSIRSDYDGCYAEGWTVNVFQPLFPPTHLSHWLQPNVAEDPKYDEQFPEHPLSRVRAMLAKIEATLQVDESVKRSPSFVYRTPYRRSWWQRLF